MRPGSRLGIDVGTVRIGVARSDPHGMLATPCETIVCEETGQGAIGRVVSLAREIDAVEVVVGLPLSLSGADTRSTQHARTFASSLAAAFPIPVRLVDERLSTVSAHSALKASGKSPSRSRPVIDQLAAVIVLQHALDSERGNGAPPGQPVTPGGEN